MLVKEPVHRELTGSFGYYMNRQITVFFGELLIL